MKILVVINSSASGLSASDTGALGFFEERAAEASEIGAKPASVSALIIGERPEKPFERPLAARHAVFFPNNGAAPHPEALASGLKAALEITAPQLVISVSSLRTKNFFPWLAADRQAAFLNEVTSVSWEGEGREPRLTFEKPLFGGKLSGSFETARPLVLALAAPRSFQGKAHLAANDSPPLVEIPVQAPPARLISREEKPDSPRSEDLTEASFIVTGGFGLSKAENFRLIEDLAQTIGASVGASRAVTDAGLQPHSRQIGQTGKTVAPELYIACAVSGAAQHIAGMRNSRVIVAINKDPSAPVFKICSYGIAGDVFVILPKLTAELKKILQKP